MFYKRFAIIPREGFCQMLTSVFSLDIPLHSGVQGEIEIQRSEGSAKNRKSNGEKVFIL